MADKVTKAKAIIVALLILKHRKQALLGILSVCGSALVSTDILFLNNVVKFVLEQSEECQENSRKWQEGS
jgi:hypothetical protein